MRTAFVDTLCEVAEADNRVWLLCGDLGFSALERFACRFPERFVNVGVAEQNMTGIAAGLALCGKVVFTYSIVNFAVMRCLEQIRNDVCYHNVNVKIVAVGGGVAYGAQGYSHHGVEDLAVMRVLPNMTVIAPGDPYEVREATRAAAAHPGPCYLRLGKTSEPLVHQASVAFRLGEAIPVRQGSDIALLSTGGLLSVAVAAAAGLAELHHSVAVLSVHTLQPLDRAAILEAARSTRGIVTVEEHGVGGLGSAVAELLAEEGLAAKLRCVRLSRQPIGDGGSQETLRARNGLSVPQLTIFIQELLRGPANRSPIGVSAGLKT